MHDMTSGPLATLLRPDAPAVGLALDDRLARRDALLHELALRRLTRQRTGRERPQVSRAG
jgi:hypothetical protein